jgi:hypothetical protein
MMAQTAIKEEKIMTDLQFKAIIEMVLQILSRSESLEDAKKALLAIKYGEDTEK